jgi:prepilin-type N-terminal cleavage/methylation domain-containing protein
MPVSLVRSASAVRRHAKAGFTIIELLVVIAVVSLLLGTVVSPLVAQIQFREMRDSVSALERVRGALIGFAQVNGRLPCPDTSAPPDGNEDCGAGVRGTLPWQTLGVAPVDRWGRFYRYAVSAEFTNASVPGALAALNQTDLTDNGNITVLGERDAAKAPVTITTNAVAVVVSTGSNGHCGTRVDNGVLNVLAPPDGGARWNCGARTGAGAADELENVDGNAVFVSRSYSEGDDNCDDAAGSAGPLCTFDDQLVWVPTTILLGKLVDAGQLP